VNVEPQPVEDRASAPPAFEAIFREEGPYVMRTLRFLGVRDASIEDVCQEVFMVVHKRLDSFQGGSMRAWVRQICVRVAQNYRRTLRRRPEDAFAEPPAAPARAEQHEALERRRLRDRLIAALDSLPEEQRETFVLYEIEELTMAEVAAALECPLQTAYSRLHAARAKIQASVGEG
jgi:RNA polymerase sigma-70 factor, ECF subfamily